ncbi:MAG TPA: DNA polymerase III subunit beta [Melioribacteraceae bacterium]|nr:DNA polymerase III subunit beta [Melioribacteraceae bacterium]
MEFKVNSTELNKVVSKLFAVINPKSPMEIYQNFLIEIKENILKIHAADVGLLVTAELSVLTTEEDLEVGFLMNAAYLNNIVKSLKDTQITFEIVPGQKATLTTPGGTYLFNILERDNYVLDLPSEEDPSFEITLNAPRIKKIIDNTSYIIQDNIKPAMMGLVFDFKEDGLRIVGTDGYRLIKTTLFDVKTDNSVLINIPRKSVHVLTKVFENTDFQISVIHDFAIIKTDNFVVYTRLVKDKFPNYDVVMLLDNEITLKVNKNELYNAVNRLFTFAAYDDLKKIMFKLDTNTLDVSTYDLKNNTFNLNEVIACKYTGIPMEIGFNCGHLNETLNHISTEGDLIFKIKEPTKPILVSLNENKENEDLLVLVMPMRINKKNDN